VAKENGRNKQMEEMAGTGMAGEKGKESGYHGAGYDTVHHLHR